MNNETTFKWHGDDLANGGEPLGTMHDANEGDTLQVTFVLDEPVSRKELVEMIALAQEGGEPEYHR